MRGGDVTLATDVGGDGERARVASCGRYDVVEGAVAEITTSAVEVAA